MTIFNFQVRTLIPSPPIKVYHHNEAGSSKQQQKVSICMPTHKTDQVSKVDGLICVSLCTSSWLGHIPLWAIFDFKKGRKEKPGDCWCGKFSRGLILRAKQKTDVFCGFSGFLRNGLLYYKYIKNFLFFWTEWYLIEPWRNILNFSSEK